MVSLMYPCVLIVLVILLMVFLVTYVVPTFATLYTSMQAKLPHHDGVPDRHRHHGAEATSSVFAAALVGGDLPVPLVGAAAIRRAQKIDRVKLRMPLLGEIWLKYQVAQLARILSTLLTGGIPLVQAMETAADSLGTPLLKRAVEAAGKSVREGQPLSGSLKAVQDLSPAGHRHDRSRRIHRRAAHDAEQRGGIFRRGREYADDGGALADRTGDHDLHGSFVAFVLIALYLPIFSLADTIR